MQIVTSFHDIPETEPLGSYVKIRYTAGRGECTDLPPLPHLPPSNMQPQPEVWYLDRSMAAPLALSLSGRYTVRALANPIPGRKTTVPRVGKNPVVCLADLGAGDLAALRELTRRIPRVRLIGLSSNGAVQYDTDCFATLPPNANPALVRKAVDSAIANIELARSERVARAQLARAEREMEELNRIGIALSETREVGALLEMILLKARQITGADAGSLYLVEEKRADVLSAAPGDRQLRFMLTQNDSVKFPFTEFELSLHENSLAGYSALHGEVINLADVRRIPHDRPYHFNSNYDKETGYRTRSLLTLPMKNGRGEVIGVLQLINRKLHPEARLTSLEAVAREVRPFSDRSVRLALSLASQAAVAYENRRLFHDIEKLFEGFVQASVKAIEQRDPTTSGHSLRVSHMTVGLAEIVDRVDTGAYAPVRFSPDQMKEVRYAALLHDFGKVGVHEDVLVKAKKLYPLQIDVIAQRFDYLYKELEVKLEREKVRLLLEMDRAEALARFATLEDEYRARRAELESAFEAIVQANEPTLLPEGKFDRIFEIARQTYQDPRGQEKPILTPEEVRFLSIPKGSLSEEERSQIEAHVVHSFNFLLQIPWTRQIREIPRIVRAHHEKLNGTGYPYKLRGDEIPLQAKIMTICDIFDALSASDRPYKKAIAPDRALNILETCVKDHELDPELYRLFVEAKIYDLATAS